MDETKAPSNHSTSAHAGEAVLIEERIGPFYPFRFRNFRLFFIGQLISVAGTWMQQVAESWLVYHLTQSATWLGIVSGTGALCYVAFAFAGGQVADRYPRRNVLLITQTAAMLLAFTLAFLAWPHSPIPIQPWHIALMAGLLGIVRAYTMPSQQAFVTDMVDDRRALPGAIALNSLRFNLARFIGPALAGFVLVQQGAEACFFWNGISFLAVILSLLLMRMENQSVKPHRQPIKEGLTYVLRTRSVLQVIVLIATASLLLWPVTTLLPVFAQLFHVGKQGYSTMVSTNGLGAALAGLSLAWFGLRIPRRYTIFAGAIGLGLSSLMFISAASYRLALACLLLIGFCMILCGISANTFVQEQVPDALRGRVMALYTLVFNALQPVGGLLIGLSADHFGAPRAVAINALLGIGLISLIIFWLSPQRHRVGVQPASASPPLPEGQGED
ncbi:MFS transporter [Chthonomonas calidirosea]|uniref:MFS transporter n=1 Tax=Chthonomonas calidirosea TaxID=454171 RepID=UPI0006EC9A06|nr:MFS transporter [Chthonomonas calidirosea]CEK13783.1 arabinose efflux permease family protein [Chthonomonas calidirosea]